MPRILVLAGVMCLVAGSAFAASSKQATQPSVNFGPATIQPGEYHSTITIVSITGLPPTTAQALTSQPVDVDDCVTTGDLNALAKSNLAANEDMTCSENKFSAGSGAISGAASCSNTDGDSGSMTFSGSYTQTHVAIDGNLALKMDLGPVTEKIHMVSDRTGQCTGAKSP